MYLILRPTHLGRDHSLGTTMPCDEATLEPSTMEARPWKTFSLNAGPVVSPEGALLNSTITEIMDINGRPVVCR